MARAIWKGVVRFGEVRVPVALYSAVVDRSVHFRLLHAKDMVPVRQRMVHPRTGEVVPTERILRGYELEDGRFVILREDELASLEPAPSRDIEVERFVPPSAIDRQWYDRPYYLGPDGDAAAYRALAVALRRKACEGVARWVMRKSAYRGALRSDGERLTLVTLRSAGEVIPVEALPAPGGRPLERKELELARQLVAALEDEFDPAAYRDEYRERVLELVRAKLEGAPVEKRRAARRVAAAPLARALETSLERARKERERRAA